ncbi:hypothetical protein SteCoe_10240 [Stentor coeruleus]|uniref:Uncharacterized protein n=1 Tax=Stentor coeruleus TaxID=5963 RepID=A0A1R2CFW9_9CILI|nr:hypothetical protein SteCoe_10240 [Stentor coeruleus]
MEIIKKTPHSKLIGINHTNQAILKSFDSELTIPLSYLHDKTGLSIKETHLSIFIGKTFTFNEETNTYNADIYYSPLVDLYKYNHAYSSRVCYKDTKFPQNPDFSKCYVSNMHFCTKETAILLGHLESALRNGFSDNILKKIAPEEKISLRNNLKNIYDFLLPENSDEKIAKSNLLTQYIQYDLENPGSVQNLADDYSIGITIISFNTQTKYTKFTILPSKPENTSIPVIKLIKYNNSVCVLYSYNENVADGYDEQGNLIKTYNPQGCSDSFYTLENIKTNSKYTTPYDSLNILSCIVRDLCLFTRDELNLIMKIDEAIVKLQPKGPSLGSFMKNLLEARELLSKKHQKPMMKYLSPTPNQEKKNLVNSKSFYITRKNSLLSPLISKSPDADANLLNLSQNSISPLKAVPSKITVNPSLSPPRNLKTMNTVNYSTNTGNPCFNSQNKSQSKNKNKVKRRKLKKCTNCKRIRKTAGLHGECNLCQKCIFQTFDSNIAKCVGCGEKIEQLRARFISRYQFTCEICFKTTRMPIILQCGCLVCGNPCNVVGHTCPSLHSTVKHLLLDKN